jgi:hypothetical protein
MKYAANVVNLNQEFSLSPGQSATVTGENLVIKFVEVISDGRCPKEAICIWPGEANCLTEITTRPESIFLKMLTQPGPFKTAKTSFANYEITFDLQPYPELGKAVDKKDYHLLLAISKKSTPRG